MEKLYSIKDIVRGGLLGVKERKLRQLIIDGEIEAINISKGSKRPNYRFTEQALQNFLTKNSVTQ